MTLATVGFGDVAPRTSVGKVLMCFFILAAFIIVPAQVNRLMDLLAIRPQHMAGYKPSSGSTRRHLLVVGAVNDAERLREFLGEVGISDGSKSSPPR